VRLVNSAEFFRIQINMPSSMSDSEDEKTASADDQQERSPAIGDDSGQKKMRAKSNMAYKEMDVDIGGEDDDDEAYEGSSGRGRKKRKSASRAKRPAKRSRKEPKVARCDDCRQPLESEGLIFYMGHPDGSAEEDVALFNPILALDTDDVDGSLYERTEYRLTNFTFYCSAGHLVEFGNGLLERDAKMFFSGYLKPVFNDSPSPDGGVAVHDAGPITQWWTAGFDYGDRHLIGVSTITADYYLTEPSEDYKPFMEELDRKVFITKLIVEHLMKPRETIDGLEYEDLLQVLESKPVPGSDVPVSSDDVIRNADYIVSAVYSYEEAGDEDEESFMMTTPCMEEIIQLSGVKKKSLKSRSYC